jgi:hypothetical protein
MTVAGKIQKFRVRELAVEELAPRPADDVRTVASSTLHEWVARESTTSPRHSVAAFGRTL